MIEGNRPWWRAAPATVSLWGCAGSVVNAPPDAAVSDLGAIDAPLVVDTPVVDTPPVIDTPPVVDTPPAVDTPLTCDAGTTLCAAACVDTATDVSHCGACNHACESTWSCLRGTCLCAAGPHLVGTVCVADDAPRPLAPVSPGDVTQRRPTLRWALPPGVDGAVVELCRDRACTMVIETLRVTGTSARPTADLPARSTVFWRMRGRAGSVERSGASPTWIFHVPATRASRAVDTSFNPHVDINGDGFDDVIVGAHASEPGGRAAAGVANVFYGSATWTQPAAGAARTPDRLLEGAAAGDWSGVVVATADDIEREGLDGLARSRPGSPGGHVVSRIAPARRAIALRRWCPIVQSAAAVGALAPFA